MMNPTQPKPPVGSALDHPTAPVAARHVAPNDARAPGEAPWPRAGAAPLTARQGIGAGHATAWYRREAWLAVCLASFLPIVVAIFAPQPWKVPLAGLSGVVLAASMLMLVLHLRRIRQRETRERVRPESAPSARR
jgi:hypothetical protein